MPPSPPDNRNDLPRPATAGVLAPPPLIYLAGLLLGLLLQRRYPVALLPVTLARVLGACFLLGGLLALPALLAFRRARTRPEPWRPTTALVTSGPYRFTRNPMYLGFTAIYLGLSLGWNALWPLLLLPLVLWLMQVGVIRREEAYLERLFGDDYRDYRRRVRRWL